MARLQPLPHPGGGAPGAAPRRQHLRRQGLLHQFRRRGARGAIKTARRYHSANGQPERFRIITFEGAFHGRTLATIAAGGQKKYLEGFGPKVEGFDQVPFGDHEALRRAITPETAAILIEPMQGEGGIRDVPTQCLRGLRELCDEHGLLLDLRRGAERRRPHRQAVRA